MKSRIAACLQVVSLVALTTWLGCSRSSPVQASVLVGKWQRVGKPAVTMTFFKEGTFSANVSGQRVLGGKYQLMDGDRIILNLDASSPKAGPITNRVSLPGELLIITPLDGKTEKYKRVE